MLIPLVQKHCINGITKEDAENIRQIPELDERVTALEQGGSDSNWKTIDYVSQTSQFFARPFFELTTRKFTKDVIMKYYSSDSNGYYSGYVYIPKGTHINSIVFNVNFGTSYSQNGETIRSMGVRSFNGNQIYSLFELGDDDGRVHYEEIYTRINLTTSVATCAFTNTYSMYNRFPITIYYNDI